MGMRWVVWLVATGVACGSNAHAPHDAGPEAGPRDAAMDAADAAGTGRDAALDAAACPVPDASFRDSGPPAEDAGERLYCTAGGLECPPDRPFCCLFSLEDDQECRASALDATDCREQPQVYQRIECRRPEVHCPCELPWCCAVGWVVCTDHSLVGEECYLDAPGLP